jgi:hypothetical protein
MAGVVVRLRPMAPWGYQFSWLRSAFTHFSPGTRSGLFSYCTVLDARVELLAIAVRTRFGKSEM